MSATYLDPRDLLSTRDQKDAVNLTSLEPVVATSTLSWPTRAWMGVVAIAAIVLAAFVADPVFADSAFGGGATAAPVDGVTIFAVFFVGALAIERLLEPLSTAILPQDAKKQAAADTKKVAANLTDAVAAEKRANPAAEPPRTPEAQAAVNAAAVAEQALSDDAWKRKVLFWAIASIVAVVVSATLKLYFLRTVGIAGPGRWEEILATGLIIGAGTKPLHDITELISAKKEAEKS